MSIAAIIVLAGTAVAQAQDGAERTTTSPSPDAIGALLRQATPKPAAIPPAGRGVVGPYPGSGSGRRSTGVRGLWPEGTTVALRTGRLERRSDEDIFVFTDGAPGSAETPDIRLLFNSRLRRMQNYIQAAQRDLEFRVIGEVTEYQDTNYLLVRELHVVKRAARAVPSGTTGVDSGSGDIIDEIVRDMGGAQAVPASLAPPASLQGAGETLSMVRWTEGTRQVGRIGRVVRQANGWAFMFESASEEPADPPVDLLPNLALQSMEDLVTGGSHGVVFVVSGDITEYSGRNYMLVRRFALRSTDGNVR